MMSRALLMDSVQAHRAAKLPMVAVATLAVTQLNITPMVSTGDRFKLLIQQIKD